MDFHSSEPRAHIRAPSLKRGKSDNGLNERVSARIIFYLFSVLYSSIQSVTQYLHEFYVNFSVYISNQSPVRQNLSILSTINIKYIWCFTTINFKGCIWSVHFARLHPIYLVRTMQQMGIEQNQVRHYLPWPHKIVVFASFTVFLFRICATVHPRMQLYTLCIGPTEYI